MRNILLIHILIILYVHNLCAQQSKESNISTIEVPIYKTEASRYIILNIGYSSSTIQNPEAWENKTKNKIVQEVDLVFTAYPKKKDEWITNYDALLKKRVDEIKKIEPSLSKNTKVKWNYILQTACKNEEEAKRMFHGVVLKYIYHKRQGYDSTSIYTFSQSSKNNDLEVINNNIESVVYGISGFEDSVVFKTFNRNNWGEMLIVNDWTGSMYPYGAQAVLWHRLNFEKNAVKYFIFFNDGNEKTERQKRIGNTGGIYYCKPDSLEYLLKVMRVVAKRGCGGDIPENNIEAILKGIRLFKGYNELVMIADNNAGVRDMILLNRITIPVKIVLCGVSMNQPIHPNYLEIARKTGGSIHTIEEDITGLKEMKEGERISISNVDYVIKKGKLVQAVKTTQRVQ